ncbi:serine/threonine protein kinase, partial [Dapis sp. BLCC M172]
MTEPITITWALVGKEALLAAVSALVKSFTEALFKKVTKPQKSSSSSSAILQQTKEQAKWIEAQSEYLKRREEREKLALAFKYKELQLQQQDLEDRRELARLQRELMRELHAQAVEVQLTEIQTIWDLENWFSKLSRQETEDILRKGQQQYRLLVLASPPDISEDCPKSFRNNLKIDIQNDLKEFLHQYYPLNPETGNFSPCPVKFYGDYFKEPIFDARVEQLHKLLAPVPTVVLYSQISDYKVNFHIGYWGLYDDEVSLLPMKAWNWKKAWQELEKAGVDNDESLLIIRQIIVMVHKLLATFVADLYYLYIDATASYESRLFELEGEFAQERFPQELVRDYIEMLRQVQQRQRDAYEAELERLARFVPWSLTWSVKGFDGLVSISADGSKLLGDGKMKKAWDLRTGELTTAVELCQLDTGGWLRTLKGHSSSVYCLAFSLDGQLLASGSDDSTIKLWHPYTRELLHTLKGRSGSVYCLAFSLDGQLLASG